VNLTLLSQTWQGRQIIVPYIPPASNTVFSIGFRITEFGLEIAIHME